MRALEEIPLHIQVTSKSQAVILFTKYAALNGFDWFCTYHLHCCLTHEGPKVIINLNLVSLQFLTTGESINFIYKA